MMRTELIREKASQAARKLKFQRISDSPTVKNYTKWRLFLPFINEEIGICKDFGLNVSVIGGNVRIIPLTEYEESVLLGSLIKLEESKINALHYASLKDALVLEVDGKSNIKIETLDRFMGDTSIHSRHLIIIFKKNSISNVEIKFDNFEDNSIETLFIESYLEKNVNVNLLYSSYPPKNSPSISIIKSIIGEGSEYRYAYLSSGGYMHHQQDENIILKKGRVYSGAGFIARHDDNVDYNVKVIHEGAGGISTVRTQGIAFDNGYVVSRGLAKISKNGIWSGTRFETGVALMGDLSKGYTVPMMEIDLGKVNHAIHEAKEFRFDKNHLFYLQSRGLAKDEALKLLLFGILQKQIEFLPDDLIERGYMIIRDILI